MKRIKRFVGKIILKIYDILHYKFSVMDILYFLTVVFLVLVFLYSLIWAFDHSTLYGIKSI